MRPCSGRFRGAVLLALLTAFSTWRFSQSTVLLPVETDSRSHGSADENRCAECHRQGESFWQTGHANTLSLASDERSSSLLQKLGHTPPELVRALQLQFRDQEIRAVDTVSGTERHLPLNWCFGSGRHARTWVGTLADSWGTTDLVEFRWTWYSALDDFDITPGQSATRGDGYFGGLGVLFDHPKARHCFACHSSQLPMPEGRLDERNIKPGVTCQRCHGPQQQHLESGGSFVAESLKQLSQSESVNRCAQCHRRADEQEPSDITPNNREIVRFQPVGLVQSRCYQNSPSMNCVTCHDPHRPLEAQDSAGIWQCTQCHDSTKPSHTLCASGHRDDCLTCHMPKVRSSAPVFFTDHWIRVRRDDEATR